MKEIPSLIPFFFYDLIARIAPGAILIGVHRRGWIQQIDGVSDLALFVGFSWAGGVLLDLSGAFLVQLWNIVFPSPPRVKSAKPDYRFDVFRFTPDRANALLRVMAQQIFLRSLALVNLSAFPKVVAIVERSCWPARFEMVGAFVGIIFWFFLFAILYACWRATLPDFETQRRYAETDAEQRAQQFQKGETRTKA